MAKRMYGEKWEIVESLAESGQAHLFLVKDTNEESGTLRVLKRLKNHARLDRFESEIKALNDIPSGRVVKPLDHSLTEPAFFVSEYYPRGSMSRAGVLEWDDSKKFAFFSELLNVIKVCHENGIVHRDLKPENVLVDDQDLPVVIDFGLSFAEKGERVTLSQEQVGSRNYMSPEMEFGRVEEVDFTADIYSLGKILYWMFAGVDLPRESFQDGRGQLSTRLGRPELGILNLLFKRVIVEDPSGRVKTIDELQAGVEKVSGILTAGGNVPSAFVAQQCIYCKVGKYVQHPPVRNDGSSGDPNFAGLTNWGGNPIRVMSCDTCGNVQTFSLKQKEISHRWSDRDNAGNWLFK